MKEEDINLILVWLERSLPKRVFAFFERTFVADSVVISDGPSFSFAIEGFTSEISIFDLVQTL